jgi:transposase
MVWITAQSPFRIPSSVAPEERVNYCIGVIDRFRRELPMLRITATKLKDKTRTLEQEVEYWKKKYQEEKKEKEKVQKEMEKLLITRNRHQVALFDHGNFKHPGASKKQKGGQIGHANTNREQREDYRSFEKKRIFAKTCGKCQSPLPRVKATKKKTLLDIVLNPEVVKLIIESERQWCGNCHIEIGAKDTRTLPFTEYGMNTFMMVLVLRFKTHSSLANIATVLSISFGLSLSKSDISNLLQHASRYLGKRYEQLKKGVRQGTVLYADETGWLVHGQKAWLWIMANEETTVYIPAISRGKGVALDLYGNSQAYAMTDGLKSYTNTIPKGKHLYCWSHILRFAFEETMYSKKDSDAVFLRDELVRIYHIKRENQHYTRDQLEKVLNEEFDALLKLHSPEEAFNNIYRRISDQREGLKRALLVTPSGTNNLAERELRNMAIKRSISHGSDTYHGMETTAVIGSVLQSLHRDKRLSFLPTLQTYIKSGIQEKHRQFIHTAYYDS